MFNANIATATIAATLAFAIPAADKFANLDVVAQLKAHAAVLPGAPGVPAAGSSAEVTVPLDLKKLSVTDFGDAE